MLYFAYGSNMCVGRLRRRVPSAAVFQAGRVPLHTFQFNKRSTDGSAKGNAFFTGNATDVVWGVIFEIDPREKRDLDEAEGLGNGYSEQAVTVLDDAGNSSEAFMYVADDDSTDDRLRPYSWYKRFVVEGARQQALPRDYIARIEAMDAIEDPNIERDRRMRQVTC